MTAVIRVPARDEDEAIASLLNAHSHALHGDAAVTAGVVTEWLEHPELVIRVVSIREDLACYGDLMLSVDGTRADIDVRAHPAFAGSAEKMLDELERLASQQGAGVARAFADSGERAYAALLARRGYRLIRHSFRMLISLDTEIAEPAFPDGIGVRTVAEGEEHVVHEANDDAFADHWGFERQPYERWARWTFEGERFDRSLNFLAVDGQHIAGICLCSMEWSGDPGYGWVGILGVRPAWRRRGIALGLLRYAFAEFFRRGCNRVGLGVDGENTTGAVRLYDRAGMHVERRHDTFEKSLV